jgi:hypothetical protein
MSSPDGNGRELRIGDAEREQAARVLGEHYAAGRLTKEEYDERSDAAFAARTAADLRPLFVDLPSLHAQQPPHAFARPAPTAQRAPVPPPPSGRWRPPAMPFLLVLLVLAIVFSHAWWLVFVLGWVVLCRPGRHRH